MNRLGRMRAASLLLGLLVAGCGGAQLQKFLTPPGPSLTRQETQVSATSYRVLPPDFISISSVRVPEINGTRQQVRPDGKINLPLINEIPVAGLTPKEIEDLINEKAKTYYKETDATVRVDQYLSQKVYVFGQVSRPGPQAWTGADTLIDVLAMAQPTQLAWPERIRLVRGKSPTRGGFDPKAIEKMIEDGGQGEREGNPESAVMIVDMMKMVQSGDMSQNVLLRPDDVVYVPPNPLAAVGLAIQQILLPIRPAAETVAAPAGAARAVSIAGAP